MRGSKWILTKSLAASLTLFTTFTVVGADLVTPPGKDPPRTEVYMARYRLIFDGMDLDKDGYLDKDELAKAFRGPNARAYDYVSPSKTSEGDKKPDDKKPDDKKPDEKKEPARTDSESTKDPKKPDYSKYPDYNFLVQLDQDMDGKISREEFLSWARDLATQLRDQAEAQQALLQAQANLQKNANKPTSKEYKAAAAALKHQQEQINKLAGQIAKAEKNLAQAKAKK